MITAGPMRRSKSETSSRVRSRPTRAGSKSTAGKGGPSHGAAAVAFIVTFAVLVAFGLLLNSDSHAVESSDAAGGEDGAAGDAKSQSSAGGLGDLKEWTQAEIEHDKVTLGAEDPECVTKAQEWKTTWNTSTEQHREACECARVYNCNGRYPSCSPQLSPFASERIDAMGILRAFRGKTIVFVGDSLGRSWNCVFRCALADHFKFKSNTFYMVPKYTFGPAVMKVPHPPSDVHVVFWNHLGLGGPPRFGGKFETAKVFKEADIVIMNVGPHCKTADALNQTLYKFHEVWQNNKKPGSVMMYRDAAPVHFASKRGVWDDSLHKLHGRPTAATWEFAKEKPPCTRRPMLKSEVSLTEHLPETFMFWAAQRFTDATRMPTIDVWNVTNNAALHPGGLDCLHVCHDTDVLHVWNARFARRYQQLKNENASKHR